MVARSLVIGFLVGIIFTGLFALTGTTHCDDLPSRSAIQACEAL